MNSSETMYVAYSLDGGGAERLLTNILLREPSPERHVVVTLRPGGVFRPLLENAGIEVLDLGMTRYAHGPRGLLRLARLIRQRRPAVIHAWDYFANVLAFAAAKLARSSGRLYWGVFGGDISGLQGHRRFRAVLRVNAWLSSRVDAVVYNADSAREYHRGIGFREPRSHVISNGIDTDVFRHDPDRRERLREELGIAPETIVVAVVARVDPQKDWPTLCEAVRDLPGVVTIAVGKGTEHLPRQRGLIGLGWRNDVVAILSAADIFLLASSFGEGASLAVGEAMLCGLACIVTDVGDNGMLVGDTGIVVDAKNAEGIRAAILQLAGDGELRAALGRAARDRAETAMAHRASLEGLHAMACAP